MPLLSLIVHIKTELTAFYAREPVKKVSPSPDVPSRKTRACGSIEAFLGYFEGLREISLKKQGVRRQRSAYGVRPGATDK